MKNLKFTVALALAIATPAFAGDITGKVTLKGTPPPEKEVSQIKDNAECSKMHSETMKTKFFVVGADNGLADTVVMLKGITGKSTGASAAPLVVDQKGCLYTPYVAACQTGQKILVKNSDPVLHNVHTEPADAGGNKSYNVPQMAGGKDLDFTYDKAENFLKFKCDVHPWMFAYVTVVDHPYFAVTDKDGNFTIKNVPAGKYTVTAMHRKAAAAGVDQEVEVKADGAKANFTLEVK